MGEQPLFVCKAHVFQLEPEFKKSWIPLSTVAVNVQFFHDSIKNIYRIVSVEGTKALINSVITPKMSFTKTSQKFGQWIDFRQNVVYGLGFSNDTELTRFVDKFKEVKDSTRSTAKQLHPHERSNSVEIAQINRDVNNSNTDSQLKYENDRLKLALAQSSSNARKWEDELITLKNSNTRLTTALQESHSNVEEWKKQLQYYKDECTRLRNIVESKNYDEHKNNSKESDGFKLNLNKAKKNEIINVLELLDQKLNEINILKDNVKKLLNDS